VTPLPWEGGPATIWRLDSRSYASTWDSGLGAFIAGGRWSPPGLAAVYCSADPSTAILEVAVHKGFDALDTVPHVLSSAIISNPEDVHVVRAADLPNPAWLQAGPSSRGQMEFGAQLLEVYPFVALPSVVSKESWNVIFNPTIARGRYQLADQRPFALDTRLNPP
jgi:RES domain-containing protein